MTESVIYALSHAAFGAIALAAMGYVVLLAGKLEGAISERKPTPNPA